MERIEFLVANFVSVVYFSRGTKGKRALLVHLVGDAPPHDGWKGEPPARPQGDSTSAQVGLQAGIRKEQRPGRKAVRRFHNTAEDG